MRVFRKVVLPTVWVVIFAAIAVSLAVMAFGSDPKPPRSGLQPTGQIPASNTVVTRGTVENTMRVTGTINIDPAVPAKATHAGVINHLFVSAGAKVKAGDNLFQIKSEGPEVDAPEGEDAPAPQARYYNVVAPTAGTVGNFSIAVNDTVGKGDTVTSIRRNSFHATGSISPVDQYRLIDLPKSATVTISSGPAPFTCRGLSIGDTAAPTDPSSGGEDLGREEFSEEFQGEGGSSGATISCRVPDDIRVFDGLKMSMAIDAGTAEDVLLVPVSAVRGLIDSGSVWVVGDDGPVERKVGLGLSDGEVVEVTKGLKEGEQILEFVPGQPSSGDEEERRGMPMEMME